MAGISVARITIGLVGAAALTIGLAACGGAETTAAQDSEAAVAASPSPEPPSDRDGDGTLDEFDYAPTDPTVQREEDVKPVSDSAAPASTAATAPAAAPAAAPASVKVPDVTGKNYQDAQDLLRANGLTVLPAKDGLGANRIPLLDANWYVVSQDVPAGSTVEAGTAVTCTILKLTDK